jgi:hypothetical protein
MLLAVALALIIAGVLYHLVIKIAAVRNRRIIIDRSESDWIDDRYQQAWHEDPQRLQVVNGRKPLVDDVHVPLVPAASDYGARRPLRADDERQGSALHEDGAPQITDEVSASDTTLARLIRDIDELMQSRKGA